MNIYEVYYYSSCGSYFAAYLKSLTLLAANEDSARNKAMKWCKANGHSFLVNDPLKLGVRLMKPGAYDVLYSDISSDY